jgi:hypothetical protein
MTVGKIRKRDQGCRLREAASLKFKKGREGKEQEEHTKSLSRTRKKIFLVCCPCLRRQVGKQVEEMWWKDKIVCGR